MTQFRKVSYWYCDQCQRRLLHGEYRYNCTVCNDFDYCETCATTIYPPHPHKMIPELAYGQEETIECAKPDIATAIRAAISMYSDRHCLGIRDVNIHKPSTYVDSYSWFKFKDIGDRSKNFGHGLRRLIEPRSYLGICAGNRPDWVITDFACIFQSIISVPIYTLFNDFEIAYIINNTKVSVIVCDEHMLPRFVTMQSQCPTLKHIVCMDPISNVMSGKQDSGIFFHYMGNLEQDGFYRKYNYVSIEPDDCLTIIYTSGSTGFPKGAIISEGAFRANFPRWCLASSTERITLSYRPLAWAADRDAIITTFLSGGRTGFSTGDSSRLMEELALVRPTYFGGPPSIWNNIYTEFKASLALITARCPPDDIAQEENLLLRKFSKLIPNRCKSIAIGGAMVSPIIFDFMKRCFTHCTVNESYGITECGSIAYNCLAEDELQYRLESIPEMGYTTEDQPFARGELLTKTPQMFSGYINNPEETRSAITEDGYFRTGDIVELRPSYSGRMDIRVIDRKKSFFKLAQGQFISPEFLQSIYMQSPFVEQIYIHGALLADCVSAVVVPNKTYTQAYIDKHNLTNFDKNNPHPQLVNAVLEDLHAIAKKELLRKHEIPSKIILDFQPFTSQNGLLTSTMKQCRPKLAAHYADQLKITDNIEQKLKTIIEKVTGKLITTDNKEENAFLNAGGDSLAVVRLSQMIQNDLGIPLSFNVLFDPQMSIQKLIDFIRNPSLLSSFSQSILPNLLKDSYLDFNINVNQCKTANATPTTIFITGTTGFVGAFLLAELLKTYPSQCVFFCLVRCKSSENPLDRIRQTMLLYQIWKDDYQQRISAFKGDLAEDHFGLDDNIYQSLLRQVEVIFHCGATVNFVLPYVQLYGANVYGTREIIRFATSNPSACIPIHYVSTISVLCDDVDKEISIDKTSPEQLTSGYAQSKWVAEKLMTQACHCGLPVTIYRLGLICADTRTGACNPHDLYTLLFSSIMKMKCYPKSIIIDGHLNGLPVDFTAKCIVYLSTNQFNKTGSIYHVINRDNEMKLVNILDCIRQLGIRLEHISDDEWRMKIKEENHGNNSIESVTEYFSKTTFRERNSVWNDDFLRGVRSLCFPLLDKIYMMKWLTYILHNIVRR